MTNREKINELGGVLLEPEGSGSDKYFLMVSEKWLDSEYKEPDHIADTSEMVEPTNKNDLDVDCISRADALDCVNIGITFCDVYKKINDLPSVTPQPRKGYWISHREHCENLGVMPSGLSAYEWCSNCDCGIDVREWYRNHYNYCPNCGARMVEPQESEGKE